MSKATRIAKSFMIDRSILDYLQRTHSNGSRSERVNALLRRAILEEQSDALAREAAEFFAAAGKAERAESRAFSAASRSTITRGEE
jgi:hypothetical protein